MAEAVAEAGQKATRAKEREEENQDLLHDRSATSGKVQHLRRRNGTSQLGRHDKTRGQEREKRTQKERREKESQKELVKNKEKARATFGRRAAHAHVATVHSPTRVDTPPQLNPVGNREGTRLCLIQDNLPVIQLHR